MTNQISTKVSTSLTPTGFVKDTFKQVKIRDLNKEERADMITLTMNTASTLSGLKGDIDPVTLKDIGELVRLKYGHISIEEIVYAFKANRYNLLAKGRVEMFNLFNADYVSKVLDAYLDWKADKIKKENLLTKSEVVKDAGEEEQRRIVADGICRHYDEYKKSETFEAIGGHYIFDVFLQCGIIKPYEDNKLEYDALISLAKEKAKKEAAGINTATLEGWRKSKAVIENISQGKSCVALNLFKKDYVSTVFGRMQAKGTTTEKLKELILSRYKPS